jgi:hypothetical protein
MPDVTSTAATVTPCNRSCAIEALRYAHGGGRSVSAGVCGKSELASCRTISTSGCPMPARSGRSPATAFRTHNRRRSSSLLCSADARLHRAIDGAPARRPPATTRRHCGPAHGRCRERRLSEGAFRPVRPSAQGSSMVSRHLARGQPWTAPKRQAAADRRGRARDVPGSDAIGLRAIGTFSPVAQIDRSGQFPLGARKGSSSEASST